MKNGEIKIRKAIKIPPVFKSGSHGRPCKYPWDKMAKGESFKKPKHVGYRSMASMCGIRNMLLKPKKFGLRTMPNGSVYCFRLA